MPSLHTSLPVANTGQRRLTGGNRPASAGIGREQTGTAATTANHWPPMALYRWPRATNGPPLATNGGQWLQAATTRKTAVCK